MKIAKGVKKKGGGIFMEYLFKLTSLGISLSRKFKRAKSMKTGQTGSDWNHTVEISSDNV